MDDPAPSMDDPAGNGVPTPAGGVFLPANGGDPVPRGMARFFHPGAAARLDTGPGGRNLGPVSDVTRLLDAIQNGEPRAAEALLPLVYAELRQLARAKMAREQSGHTLQATALVHEAWLRLGDQGFENRAHFFGAAAEAMRRILIERARRKLAAKHGAGAKHVDADEIEIAAPTQKDDELLAVHDALDALAAHDARKAELVKLRYFVGFTIDEAADVLGISAPTAKRDWTYARAWLFREMGRGQ